MEVSRYLGFILEPNLTKVAPDRPYYPRGAHCAPTDELPSIVICNPKHGRDVRTDGRGRPYDVDLPFFHLFTFSEHVSLGSRRRRITRVRKLNLGWCFFASKVAFSWPPVDRFGKNCGGLMTLGQVQSVPNFGTLLVVWSGLYLKYIYITCKYHSKFKTYLILV